MRNTGIVCGVKWPQTSRNKLLVDPFRDRGSAVLLETRRIEDPITESCIVEFSLDDPRGHGLGGHLEPDVRGSGAVPLAVPHERFGAIPATDEGFIRRLYRTRPEVLRRVLIPLLAPQSAAIRHLEEILAEEDEAELAQSEVVLKRMRMLR